MRARRTKEPTPNYPLLQHTQDGRRRFCSGILERPLRAPPRQHDAQAFTGESLPPQPRSLTRARGVFFIASLLPPPAKEPFGQEQKVLTCLFVHHMRFDRKRHAYSIPPPRATAPRTLLSNAHPAPSTPRAPLPTHHYQACTEILMKGYRCMKREFLLRHHRRVEKTAKPDIRLFPPRNVSSRMGNICLVCCGLSCAVCGSAGAFSYLCPSSTCNPLCSRSSPSDYYRTPRMTITTPCTRA